jgi:hypothetical protein
MPDFRAYLGDRSLARTTALLLVLATAGCDDVGKNYPVIGRVLVNGQALQGMEGSVMFKPRAKKEGRKRAGKEEEPEKVSGTSSAFSGVVRAGDCLLRKVLRRDF